MQQMLAKKLALKHQQSNSNGSMENLMGNSSPSAGNRSVGGVALSVVSSTQDLGTSLVEDESPVLSPVNIHPGLREGFNSIAVDGRVNLEQLCLIINAEGVDCTTDKVQAAVTDGALPKDNYRHRHSLDESSSFTLEEAADIFNHLTCSTAIVIPTDSVAKAWEEPSEQQQSDQRPSWFQTAWRKCTLFLCCRCCRSNAVQDSEVQESSSIKPGTKLLIVMVIVALIMGLTVAAVAIGINWGNSTQNQLSALQRQLSLMKNAAEFFALQQARLRTEKNLYTVASILASMISEMGYGLSTSTTQSGQLDTVRSAGSMIDQLFLVSGKNEMANTAKLLAEFLERMFLQGYADNVVNVVNALNTNGMPADYEIVLGKMGDNNKVQFLSTLKFKSQCPNGVCGSDILILSALSGVSGSVLGPDYASITVIAGYAYLPTQQLGLVYKCKLSTLQAAYQARAAAAINQINSMVNGTTELLLLQTDNVTGSVISLTTLKYKAACVKKCNPNVFQYAMNGSGTQESVGYRGTGSFVLASYVQLPYTNATLLLKVDVAEVTGTLLSQLGAAGTRVSDSLPGTKEMVLATKVMNGSTPKVQFLTDLKYRNDCLGVCASVPGSAQAISAATLNCQQGYMTVMDYRGHSTVAGYACSPELSVGVSFKMDDEELMSNSLKEAVQYADVKNGNATDTTELIIGVSTSSSGATTSMRDLQCLTTSNANPNSPFQNQCPNDEAAAPMIQALQGRDGTMNEVDYSGQKVISAYTYSSGLSAGLVFKIDKDYIEKPLIIQLIILLFTALGIVLLGILVLGYSARRMLNGIMDSWEKGKEAVEKQKESFQNLISALYPKFATERLLAGDRSIVLYLPEASIFYSEIHNFALLAQRLTAEELVNWIGYTYRVMDEVAEFTRVYKIKTIGDIYFAISGLPNAHHTTEAEDEEEVRLDAATHGHAFRMLAFASYVAQVFSEKYDHPPAGACLQAVTAKITVVSVAQAAAGKHKSSQGGSSGHGGSSISSGGGEGELQKKSSGEGELQKKNSSGLGAGGSSSSGSSIHNTTPGQISSLCAMQYGIALGPVTSGVVHGKCPAFDVWGPAVSLASRLQASSKPCRIHVSEGLYRAVAAMPNTPFVWDKPTVVFAKGFGNITSYLLKGSYDTPPKELMVKVGLEAQLGFFPFDVPTKEPDRLHTNAAHMPLPAAASTGTLLGPDQSIAAKSFTSADSGVLNVTEVE